MSTEVVLYTARHELKRRAFAPTTNMEEAIRDVLSASNLNVSVGACTVRNEEGDIITVKRSRLLGAQPLEVEVPPTDEVQHLRTELSAQKAELTSLKLAVVVLAKGTTGSIAAEVLRLVFEFTTLKASESSRVCELTQDNSALVKMATLAQKTPVSFAKVADDIITRRNNDGSHWPTIQALDEEVRRVKPLLDIQDIKTTYKWEAWTIENYDKIKEIFPEQFKVV